MRASTACAIVSGPTSTRRSRDALRRSVRSPALPQLAEQLAQEERVAVRDARAGGAEGVVGVAAGGARTIVAIACSLSGSSSSRRVSGCVASALSASLLPAPAGGRGRAVSTIASGRSSIALRDEQQRAQRGLVGAVRVVDGEQQRAALGDVRGDPVQPVQQRELGARPRRARRRVAGQQRLGVRGGAGQHASALARRGGRTGTARTAAARRRTGTGARARRRARAAPSCRCACARWTACASSSVLPMPPAPSSSTTRPSPAAAAASASSSAASSRARSSGGSVAGPRRRVVAEGAGGRSPGSMPDRPPAELTAASLPRVRTFMKKPDDDRRRRGRPRSSRCTRGCAKLPCSLSKALPATGATRGRRGYIAALAVEGSADLPTPVARSVSDPGRAAGSRGRLRSTPSACEQRKGARSGGPPSAAVLHSHPRCPSSCRSCRLPRPPPGRRGSSASTRARPACGCRSRRRTAGIATVTLRGGARRRALLRLDRRAGAPLRRDVLPPALHAAQAAQPLVEDQRRATPSG